MNTTINRIAPSLAACLRELGKGHDVSPVGGGMSFRFVAGVLTYRDSQGDFAGYFAGGTSPLVYLGELCRHAAAQTDPLHCCMWVHV